MPDLFGHLYFSLCQYVKERLDWHPEGLSGPAGWK